MSTQDSVIAGSTTLLQYRDTVAAEKLDYVILPYSHFYSVLTLTETGRFFVEDHRIDFAGHPESPAENVFLMSRKEALSEAQGRRWLRQRSHENSRLVDKTNASLRAKFNASVDISNEIKYIDMPFTFHQNKDVSSIEMETPLLQRLKDHVLAPVIERLIPRHP